MSDTPTIVIDAKQLRNWSQSQSSELHRQLKERGALNSPLHRTESEKFAASVQGAGTSDCLKPAEGKGGSSLGLLALPGLLWDAGSGKCK
jgi:hypothetical protein